MKNAFAIGESPTGKIKDFIEIKLRTTKTFEFLEDINKFKSEIYTERINLDRNTLESFSYEVQEVQHYFKVTEGGKQIFVESNTEKIPVPKGTETAYDNSLKKTWNFVKKGTGVIDKIMILDEMRNMIPSLSNYI